MNDKVRKPTVNAKTLRRLALAVDFAHEEFDPAFHEPLTPSRAVEEIIAKRGLSGRVQYNRLKRDIEEARQWVRELERWYWSRAERKALKQAEGGKA